METLEIRLALALRGFVVHDIDQARAGAEPRMFLADLDGDGAPEMLSKNIWRAAKAPVNWSYAPDVYRP